MRALQQQRQKGKNNNKDLGRVVVLAFGGGFVSENAALFGPAFADLAERFGTQVFAPEYRIAPEHPAAAAVEDVYAVAAWLQAPSSAAEFGVNPARIVVGGVSAAGGVAANAALLGRDRGLNPPLAAQLLRHPMLDDCTSLAPDDRMRPYLIWTAENNELAWPPYLAGGGRYAAAARAEDISGLPPTFVGVGSLDLFRDEGVAYAARLARTGAAVEFHLYLGVPHGFKGAAPGIRQTREMEDEVRFVRRFSGDEHRQKLHI